MGDPFFKIRDALKAKGVVAFSSNYELYGDISSRVQRTIESLAPRVEVYSIDESLRILLALQSRLGTSHGRFRRASEAGRVCRWALESATRKPWPRLPST